MRRFFTTLICVALLCGRASGMAADEATCAGADSAMTLARLGEIVMALDPDAVQQGQGWRLRIGGQVTLLTADAAAGRMRAMMPIGREGDMDKGDLRRMLQANFDSALDGRYAIARGLVWSVFTHSLGSLDKNLLIEGLAQAAMLARTHGTLYSGGDMQFGGGDSPGLQLELLEDLHRRGEDL